MVQWVIPLASVLGATCACDRIFTVGSGALPLGSNHPFYGLEKSPVTFGDSTDSEPDAEHSPQSDISRYGNLGAVRKLR